MNKNNNYFFVYLKMSRVISYNINPNLSVQTGVHKTYFIIRGRSMTDDEINNQKTDNFDPDGFYLRPDNHHYIFYYPQEFVAPSEAGEDKYVIFQYCHCKVQDSLPADIEIHSTIVPRDTYCDSLVYYCNLQPPDDNRKYRVNTNKRMGFEVWFTDSSGRTVIMPDTFVVFFKLLY